MFHRMIVYRFFPVLLVCFLVSSCSFSPKYARDTSLIEGKKEYENALQNKISVGNLARWWEGLDDPLILSMVDKLLAQNLSLKVASERVIQARLAASISNSAHIPSLVLNNGASRSFTTSVTSNGVKKRVSTDSYTTDLGVSWQVDLFGKLRSANDAARANALAVKYDLQGITHTLIAELISRRVSVYLHNKLLELATENHQSAKKLYVMAKRRYELGGYGIKLTDVYLAEENYESSNKDIYQYRRLLADEMYKLDILLAQVPGTIKKESLTTKVSLPKPIGDVGIPMQLLDRRPDLKSAEIKIVAANANVGVAISDLFPDLLIGSSMNYRSDSFGKLFSADNMSGAILGKITTKIFSGGALRNNIKIQKSKAKELALNYAEKILKAVSEVESALKADSESTLEYKVQKNSLTLFERNQKYLDLRYSRGVSSFVKLLENKIRMYNAYKLLIASEQKLWQSRINLYLSLGGDWVIKD
jgi:outer membrane protein, multidrug efflux system